MDITYVEYGRLKSLPGYENEKVVAEAEVGQGETAQDALAKLKDWVNGQLGLPETAVELAQKVAELQRQKADLEGEVERLTSRRADFARAVALLTQMLTTGTLSYLDLRWLQKFGDELHAPTAVPGPTLKCGSGTLSFGPRPAIYG